ncbi:P-loop containing nucleoside triphosphate hydrolase protein [Gautieria morchelliformis]|nr:P-loop containing nucleoside triphosphate hydrolase protein [Gautieria morchelliformis]
MRYSFSKSLRRSTRGPVVVDSEKTPLADGNDESAVVTLHVPLPALTLKIKKVDHVYSRWSKKWKYQTSGSNAIPEPMSLSPDGNDDSWQQFCFVVVREIPRREALEPYFQIVVKSPYLLKACKDVIGEVEGISWNNTLPLDPKLLLAFFPRFQAYRNELKANAKTTGEDANVVATLDVLIDYFRKDYGSTLAAIENLTSHAEITFDLLYAILVPRTIMITTNPVTKELQALQLVLATKTTAGSGMPIYELILEAIDVDDAVSNVTAFARTQSRMIMTPFPGTIKVTSLDAYPIQYHPREADVRQTLLARARKWTGFAHGIHHMYYNGTGAYREHGCKITKYNVASRVMIDRGNFKKFNLNYPYPLYKSAAPAPLADEDSDDLFPTSGQSCKVSDELYIHVYPPVPVRRGRLRNRHHFFPDFHADVEDKEKRETAELTDEELLIASPILYAFSLSDKLWLELNVTKVEEIEWNEEAFSNLVLPSDRKTLLKSLVEAHNAGMVFDDFIQGKGRGLVVNLFGPPGVGKTLSAEATSEHVKRPLYVVGAGDLGTRAAELDPALQRIFEVATSWKAIVLIDEADVFLEQRSLHDLERNAMVAVFLRHLEYYPAILFLTTNRVKTFDEAFLSRIHIALHFHALPAEARRAVWTAFLGKAGVEIGQGGVSGAQLERLVERDLNGRQVKNATRTAGSLAMSRGETLCYGHLTEVLDVMDKFSAEFAEMREDS